MSTFLSSSARRGAAGIAALVLGLSLTACQGSQPGETIRDPEPTVTETTSTSAPATTSSSTATSSSTTATSSEPATTSSSPTRAARGGDPSAAQKAIDTAQEAAGNGTAYELDWDDGRWEVDVRNGNTKQEIKVSADGTSVVDAGRVKDIDAKDIERIESATITLWEAISIALDEVPGTIDEAELETHNGKLAYEVELYAEDGSEKNVYVDALTNDIMEVTNG